jgi:glycosyltransferase involved in cell wall biosynthesis
MIVSVPRIAIVFESFVRAGSQRHLVEILKGVVLFRPDIECVLFLISIPDQHWNSFLPEVRGAGVEVISVPYVYDRIDGLNLQARVHNWWSRRHREHTLNAEFYDQLLSFDSVVCAQPYVADLLLPNLKPCQRLCFHLMEHLAQRSTSWNYRLLQKRGLHLIYMHASQIAQLSSIRSPNPTITWPVRLCPDHLQELPHTMPDHSGELRIAHYSRISPMRLIDQVIDAFALLRKHTNTTLRIAGFIEDQDYYSSLLSQIERLGLSNAVHFVDPVPSPAEDPARSQVDLVWMISLSGHVGYAALESMAAGFPTLLLEVDVPAVPMPADPDLEMLICSTPEQLVDRSLAVQNNPSRLREQQSQLMRRRFLTTEEGIDELVGFYLGQP